MPERTKESADHHTHVMVAAHSCQMPPLLQIYANRQFVPIAFDVEQRTQRRQRKSSRTRGPRHEALLVKPCHELHKHLSVTGDQAHAERLQVVDYIIDLRFG